MSAEDIEVHEGSGSAFADLGLPDDEMMVQTAVLSRLIDIIDSLDTAQWRRPQPRTAAGRRSAPFVLPCRQRLLAPHRLLQHEASDLARVVGNLLQCDSGDGQVEASRSQ